MPRKPQRPPGDGTREPPELEPLPMIGESPIFRATLERARMLARLRRPVLITGSSGSGKEAMARFIHMESGLTGAFVALNCATVPEDIAEAEFFGYQRGAFTGAQEDHVGLVGQAANGTLFLDEVAELPHALQLKLLRVLHDGSHRRLGAPFEQKVAIRIIAATNRPLEPLVEKGLFREDLLYRLRMLRLELPPLRERGDDAVLIARHFLAEDPDCGPRNLTLSPPACEVLIEYPWPGNVRELQSALLEASLIATADVIEGPHLESVLNWKRPRRDATDAILDLFPKEGVMSVRQLRALAGLPPHRFKREIGLLEKRGLIRRIGQGKHRQYASILIGSGKAVADEGVLSPTLDTHRNREILLALKREGPASRLQLARALKISDRTMNRLLSDLVDAGVLRIVGRGRGTRYQRIERGNSK